MQRITVSIDESLTKALDALLSSRGYRGRSEGVRDLVRQAVELWRLQTSPTLHCVASLSYIYNPRTRALASRLADLQHAHHDLVVSTTQVRLDHENCLESVLLRGLTAEVRAFTDLVRAERGVRFEATNLVAVDLNDAHEHEGDHVHVGGAHASPHPG